MTTHPPGIARSTERMEVTPRFARLNFLGVGAALVLLVLFVDPAGRASDLGRFLSRFHPSLVHFPIGFLGLAIGLDIADRFGKNTMDWARWMYVAGSWAGLAAVAAGLWLAQSGGYPEDTIFLHKMAGLLVTAGAAGIPWLQSAVWSTGRDALAISATGVLAIAVAFGGHEGGTLTHGPDYLTAHAPNFVRAALGLNNPIPRFALGDPDSTTVFRGIVQPILRDRCVACHGQDKTRGGLDLRTAESISEGSEDGPVVNPGRPDSSPLIARIQLPDGHRRKMPPEDATPLSPSDALLLSWWVSNGAPFEETLSDVEMPPHIRAILEAHGLGDIRTGVWALDVLEPDQDAVSRLEALGARVRRVAQNEVFLQVRCDTRDECFADGGAALTALADHIVWLDLARTDVSDVDIAMLQPLKHLERVWLQKTGVTRLAGLEEASFLSYLNVSETGVTPDALVAVAHVRDVYSWGTPEPE
ncbi:MAG: putative membrane protein [Rhodothermales bacterium]|jgi:uncharacterized membrane protein